MQNIIKRIDDLAGISPENKIAAALERTAFVFLLLMVLSAPHSIAATQIAWLTGMLVWVLRLFVRPRPRLVRTPLDLALWAFFAWAIVAAVFSYEPLISFSKLRGAGLFLIFYFVINNIRGLRAVRLMAFSLILSCMVNVFWMPVERIIGRGVEIHGLSEESPLTKALLREGDTLLKANGVKFASPEGLVDAIKQTRITKVEFYRPDFYFTVEVKRADLIAGGGALENLGIKSWKRSRNWRSQGFYGHYATYAEVLQLIASLTFGLFIGGIFVGKFDGNTNSPDANGEMTIGWIWGSALKPVGMLLLFCLAGMAFALLLTVTRASQFGFLVSVSASVLLNGSRRMMLVVAAIAVPVVIGGLVFLQQSREIGFIDRSDDSTTYRETVYREGIALWLDNPRHFFVGIGMDTATNKEFVRKWHLFDDGKLAASHFHSTPIQLLVERGLFGLLLWLAAAFVYLRTLWKWLSEKADDNAKEKDQRFRRGLILGCIGGALGFFTSGLVHYNLGDGEVAMVFYMLMGVSVAVCGLGTGERPENGKMRESRSG